MKITYDPHRDRLHILLRNAPIEYSRAEADPAGMLIDFDDAGRVVGLEIRDASHRMSDPRSVEFRESTAASPSREEIAAGAD